MSEDKERITVLYLVYWGALEPLGRSLVVPAINRLAGLGVDLTLVTFEKPAHLANKTEVQELSGAFEAVGVRWRPLRYHRTPKWPATAFDTLAAVVAALRARVTRRFDVVHARTFVAGPMGFLIAQLLGARFVYHNEGFYPDEQVDGGVWKQDSIVHRLARGVETFLYDRADAVIALSERARRVLVARQNNRRRPCPVIVVPSAVDLEAFQPAVMPRGSTHPPSLVYLGSVGLRYRLDDAGRFVAAMRRVAPGTTLTVVSRAERALVESMLDSSGLPREAWRLKELPYAAVSAELILHDAGLLFLPQGLSEHGASPTKVGEYWACGLPVVTTPNVSDIDEIVREARVGVVVRGEDPDSLDSIAAELVALLQDPELSLRCRRAAESSYPLEVACLRQKSLYRDLAL